MKYKAKVDGAAIGFFVMMPIVYGVFNMILQKKPLMEVLPVMLIGYVICGGFILVMKSVHYIVGEDSLVIKICGIPKSISYRRIKEIQQVSGAWDMESPSVTHLRLLDENGDKLAKVAPIMMEEFEQVLRSKIDN